MADIKQEIADYLSRVDARLESAGDDGARGVLLNTEIEKWEGRLARLRAWAAADSGRPNPLGEGASAFDVEHTIGALHQRLADLRRRIQARIAALNAEAVS